MKEKSFTKILNNELFFINYYKLLYMRNRVVCFFKRLFCVLLAVTSLYCVFFTGVSFNSGVMLSQNTTYSNYKAFPSVIDLIRNFFDSPFKNKDDESKTSEYVYLAGFPIGIAIENDGVVVIAKGTVSTLLGEVNTSEDSDIQVGDIIVSLNDEKISSTADIALFLENKYIGSGSVSIKLKRGNSEINTVINPTYDILSNKYKLGLWVRDTVSGVGTMTFIREDGSYSALGHPISDIDTASKIDVKNGNIFKCNIIGVQKGKVKAPGELKGLFLKSGASIGSVSDNTNFGIRGTVDKSYLEKLDLTKIKVGRKGSVKAGKAKIISTVDGVVPEEFDIEIVKTSIQNAPDNKSMIIHVTDKRLLEKTGGIVQGMSGSPIVQDGKIVGAVTHVFVSDPTRGYGLYMDWMLD